MTAPGPSDPPGLDCFDNVPAVAVYRRAADPGRGLQECWTVSDRQMWLPGNYASEATARRAVDYDDAVLADLERRICWVRERGGQQRPITDADLDEALAGPS